MGFEDILYEVDDGVAQITLNRPDKLNALSWGTLAEIETAMQEANGDELVRCVLLTGAGRGFSSGTDLTDDVDNVDEDGKRPFHGREATMRSRHRCTDTIYHCTKPTIAAVNGVSVGAGFSLALACDIRLASDTARFSAIFVKRGLSADTGSTWFLPRLVGMDRALDILYTGRLVEAEEAFRIGLVTRVVPGERLMDEAHALAREIASGPTLAVEINKRLAREGMNRELSEHIEAEEYHQAITKKSEDAQEGVDSFLEKRPPRFQGK